MALNLKELTTYSEYLTERKKKIRKQMALTFSEYLFQEDDLTPLVRFLQIRELNRRIKILNKLIK